MPPEARCAFVSPKSPKAFVLRKIQQQLVQQAQREFDREHQNDKHRSKRPRIDPAEAGTGAGIEAGAVDIPATEYKSVEELFEEMIKLEKKESEQLVDVDSGDGDGDATIGGIGEEVGLDEEQEESDKGGLMKVEK